jgi:hypothetical protein
MPNRETDFLSFRLPAMPSASLLKIPQRFSTRPMTLGRLGNIESNRVRRRKRLTSVKVGVRCMANQFTPVL